MIGTWPLPITDEITALLKPAAERAGETIQTGPGWTLWTVHDGPELIGAANASRTIENTVEVVQVGGKGFRRWLGRLDELVGAWARDEGATCLRAYGRSGWAHVLKRGVIGPDWRMIGQEPDATIYERQLNG